MIDFTVNFTQQPGPPGDIPVAFTRLPPAPSRGRAAGCLLAVSPVTPQIPALSALGLAGLAISLLGVMPAARRQRRRTEG